jgi:hypothetical protein
LLIIQTIGWVLLWPFRVLLLILCLSPIALRHAEVVRFVCGKDFELCTLSLRHSSSQQQSAAATVSRVQQQTLSVGAPVTGKTHSCWHKGALP